MSGLITNKKKMKNWYLLLFVFTLFLSCKKEEDVRGIDLNYREVFEIPAGIGVFDVHHFYIKNIFTRFESTLAQGNIKTEDILRVLTVEATMAGQFGDANLDFVDRIALRVFNNDDVTNYLEIAYRDPSPIDPGNLIGLIRSLVDSKSYFNTDRFGIDVVIYLRRTTNESTAVQLDFKMRAAY